MDITTNIKNKDSKGPHNPHRKLHNIILLCATILLTGQVLEGSFLIPFVCVYFGFPDLSLKEVCDEMSKMAYADEDRYCEYPYPLFADVPEPWTQKNVDATFPPATPPRPNFERLGFREVLEFRKQRAVRQSLESQGESK